MKKMYFTVKPENFIIYNGLSREGKLSYKEYDEFVMNDTFYERLFFEAPRKTIYGSTIVRELVTGTKFLLELEQNKSGTVYATFSGLDREIKSTRVVLSKTRVDNSIVAGFFTEMENDEKMKEEYVDNILQFMAMSKAKSKQRRRDIEGPSRGLVRELRELSRIL